ncbi:MAG: hypothetical protein ACJ04Q_11655 [Flavobacteriales bacterium]
MTFQEALNFKQQFDKEQLLEGDISMEIFVVPSNPNDLNNYIIDYRRCTLSDGDAKQYSSDNKFKVFGLWYDGADVLYKNLSI